jgi:hypothetical protein
MIKTEAENCFVPPWVVSRLGRVITIKNEFKDVNRTWPARSAALLVSIQAGRSGSLLPGYYSGTSGDPRPYATCIILGDKGEAEENFFFDEIAP